MLRLLRPKALRLQAARTCKSAGALPGRSKLALTAGFIIAASMAILIGPNPATVLAGADDNASFWRAENARKAAQRKSAAPAVRSARAIERGRAPRNVSAYAPAPEWQGQRLQARHGQVQREPFWAIVQPGALRAPSSAAKLQPARTPNAAPSRVQRVSVGGRSRQATNRRVCVRLCDGYFFPAPVGLSASDAGCALACPNAPTQLYTMRSDRIADAISTRGGAAYTRLPVAFRYTRSREPACSCGAMDPKAAILADASLRRGDRFMTERGFLIYQGARNGRATQKNFASLSKARGISRQERKLLLAMEQVSLPRPAERLANSFPTGRHVALGPPRGGALVVLR